MTLKAKISVAICILFAGVSEAAPPSIKVPPTIGLNWATRSYEGTAPAPFGEVRLVMDFGGADKSIKDLRIWIGGKRLSIPPELYRDLVDPSEVDFAYSDPSQTSSGKVEYIGFYFEVGDPIRVRLGDDIPGCPPPCYHWMRNIVEIRVTRNLKVERIVQKAEELDRVNKAPNKSLKRTRVPRAA